MKRVWAITPAQATSATYYAEHLRRALDQHQGNQSRAAQSLGLTLRQFAYRLKKTGLRIDAYFSGTKLRWLLDHVNGAHIAAAKGRSSPETSAWRQKTSHRGMIFAAPRARSGRTAMRDG